MCVVEIGVDGSIAVLTIAEHVAWCDPVAIEMFALRTDYHSGAYIQLFIYDLIFPVYTGFNANVCSFVVNIKKR